MTTPVSMDEARSGNAIRIASRRAGRISSAPCRESAYVPMIVHFDDEWSRPKVRSHRWRWRSREPDRERASRVACRVRRRAQCCKASGHDGMSACEVLDRGPVLRPASPTSTSASGGSFCRLRPSSRRRTRGIGHASREVCGGPTRRADRSAVRAAAGRGSGEIPNVIVMSRRPPIREKFDLEERRRRPATHDRAVGRRGGIGPFQTNCPTSFHGFCHAALPKRIRLIARCAPRRAFPIIGPLRFAVAYSDKVSLPAPSAGRLRYETVLTSPSCCRGSARSCSARRRLPSALTFPDLIDLISIAPRVAGSPRHPPPRPSSALLELLARLPGKPMFHRADHRPRLALRPSTTATRCACT